MCALHTSSWGRLALNELASGVLTLNESFFVFSPSSWRRVGLARACCTRLDIIKLPPPARCGDLLFLHARLFLLLSRTVRTARTYVRRTVGRCMDAGDTAGAAR